MEQTGASGLSLKSYRAQMGSGLNGGEERRGPVLELRAISNISIHFLYARMDEELAVGTPKMA